MRRRLPMALADARSPSAGVSSPRSPRRRDATGPRGRRGAGGPRRRGPTGAARPRAARCRSPRRRSRGWRRCRLQPPVEAQAPRSGGHAPAHRREARASAPSSPETTAAEGRGQRRTAVRRAARAGGHRRSTPESPGRRPRRPSDEVERRPDLRLRGMMPAAARTATSGRAFAGPPRARGGARRRARRLAGRRASIAADPARSRRSRRSCRCGPGAAEGLDRLGRGAQPRRCCRGSRRARLDAVLRPGHDGLGRAGAGRRRRRSSAELVTAPRAAAAARARARGRLRGARVPRRRCAASRCSTSTRSRPRAACSPSSARPATAPRRRRPGA